MRGGGFIRHSLYDWLSSLPSLLDGWQEFKQGKGQKIDVQNFGLNLEHELFALHEDLTQETYRHGGYSEFYLHDPKLRHIHKASVRDRIVHHVVMRAIEDEFEPGFIFDSYSSRLNKGTHRAVERFRRFAWKLSRNNTRTVWILKCDIRKFFDSVDHGILKRLIRCRVKCGKTLHLIDNIIDSFYSASGKGIPLGNVTSQLFSNIYLNELDQFVKRRLSIKYYIRYADDFVLLSRDRAELERALVSIRRFLNVMLNMQLHPQKVIFQKWNQGVDYLGYISFPHHTILRTKTKRRMLKKLQETFSKVSKGLLSKEKANQSLQSYLGLLTHCRGKEIRKILNKKITES